MIVQAASISAYDGQVTMVPYAAAKGAIVSMTLPMARDLARFGIRVCSIAPGAFRDASVVVPADPADPRARRDVPEAGRRRRRVRIARRSHRHQPLHERRGHPSRRRRPTLAEHAMSTLDPMSGPRELRARPTSSASRSFSKAWWVWKDAVQLTNRSAPAGQSRPHSSRPSRRTARSIVPTMSARTGDCREHWFVMTDCSWSLTNRFSRRSPTRPGGRSSTS